MKNVLDQKLLPRFPRDVDLFSHLTLIQNLPENLRRYKQNMRTYTERSRAQNQTQVQDAVRRRLHLLTNQYCAVQVVYKNSDIRLELSRLARIVDPKMKIMGEVAHKCENVATLDPISFETPEAFIRLPKWNTKRTGSISFDFRTTEPNGLILFTHGRPQERKDASRSQKNAKVTSRLCRLHTR